MRVVEIVHRQGKLLEVVGALRSPRRLARGLHGRQQQRDEDANDGNYHQQFNQGKAGLFLSQRAAHNGVLHKEDLN
jgi:hypothetical protein